VLGGLVVRVLDRQSEPSAVQLSGGRRGQKFSPRFLLHWWVHWSYTGSGKMQGRGLDTALMCRAM